MYRFGIGRSRHRNTNKTVPSSGRVTYRSIHKTVYRASTYSHTCTLIERCPAYMALISTGRPITHISFCWSLFRVCGQRGLAGGRSNRCTHQALLFLLPANTRSDLSSIVNVCIIMSAGHCPISIGRSIAIDRNGRVSLNSDDFYRTI